jgi:hypothetical protein
MPVIPPARTSPPQCNRTLGACLTACISRPRGPLTGEAASTIGSSSTESWVLAADRPAASGMPRRSTSGRRVQLGIGWVA